RAVCGGESRSTSDVFDLLNRLGTALGVASVHDDVCTLSRELECDRVAEACGTPGAQSGAALKSVHTGISPIASWLFQSAWTRATAPPRLRRCSTGMSAS